MIEAIAAAIGVVVGICLSLIPGLHPALILGLIVASPIPAITGPGPCTCFIAAAAGVTIYSRRLNSVYNVAAGSDDTSSMEPALKMTADGDGATALRLMIAAADLAIIVAIVLAAVTTVFSFNDVNAPKALNQLLGPIGIVVILIWLAATVLKAKHKLLTILGLTAVAAIGYITLHHPHLTGDAHQLAPIMSGVFGIPIALTILMSPVNELPPQNKAKAIPVDPSLAVIGVVVGAITGFLAGLGAGSLVSLFESHAEDDAGYLLMASAAESMNDVLALGLILIAGMGRSGEAIALGKVAGQTSIPQGLIGFAIVVIAAVIGRQLVFALEHWYQDFIRSQAPKTWASIIIAIASAQLLLLTHPITGILVTLAAIGVSLWMRSQSLPLQTSFGALAIPLVLQHVGAVPALNAIVF